MSREDARERVKQVGIIPALRSSDPAVAVRAVEAIRSGGIEVAELSFALPNALPVLAEVVRVHGATMLIGAGTVVDAEGVRLAVSAGAQFIVTPGFSADAVKMAAELDTAIFVGALTPTEVQLASASGSDAVKLFPCYAMGGARYLKSLLSQYPKVPMIASGGVGLDNCRDYIRAGAYAIGVGGEIADAESMASGDFRVFTVRARRLREAVKDYLVVRDSLASITVGEAR